MTSPNEPWALLERLRWAGAPPECVRCGVAGRCTLLPGIAGSRRVWRCGACRSQFSVLSGTLLERTRLPPQTWPPLVRDLAAGTEAVRELARRHAITPETARLVRDRVAAAGLAGGDLADLLRLPPDEVARIADAVPRRSAARRREPGWGPSADYR